VTWRLKAGIVESEETSIPRQWFGKYVLAATSTEVTIEVLLETMFHIRSVQSCYQRREFRYGRRWWLPCGGGVEYLHRSPASRTKRRKGNPVPGGITGPPRSWAIKIRGPGPPGWESLKSERVKCCHESRGSRTWEWMCLRGPAAIANYRPIVSLERMLHRDYESTIQLKNCWSWVSRGLSPRRTDCR
jgi:hypothetical protein